MGMADAAKRAWTLVEALFVLVFLAITAVGSSLTIYWMFFDVAVPMRVLRAPNGAVLDRPVEARVHRGGTLKVERFYCIDRVMVGEVNRRIVDTVVYPYPRADAFTEVGCFRPRVHSVDIPSLLPNGRYTYRTSVTYRINPLRTEIVDLPEIPFEVVDEPVLRPPAAPAAKRR